MLKDFPNFLAIFKQGASRGAASGGSVFLKNYIPLRMLNNFPNFLAIFKQGASRGAASGGSDFWKIASPWECWKIFRTF